MVNSIPKLSVDPLLLQLIATPAPALAPEAAAAPAAAPTPPSAAAATTALHLVFTSGSTQPRRGSGVGRTHTIIRLQTRIRRKDGTESFGGFVYVLDGFLQRDFVLWVFMCSINFSVSLFRLPRRELPHPTDTARATTPRAITPLPPLHGYHAGVYISQLSRHSLVLLLGYHTRAMTLHHTRTSGYHTRHSS